MKNGPRYSLYITVNLIVIVEAEKIWYLKNVRFLLGHPVDVIKIKTCYKRFLFVLTVKNFGNIAYNSNPALLRQNCHENVY